MENKTVKYYVEYKDADGKIHHSVNTYFGDGRVEMFKDYDFRQPTESKVY